MGWGGKGMPICDTGIFFLAEGPRLCTIAALGAGGWFWGNGASKRKAAKYAQSEPFPDGRRYVQAGGGSDEIAGTVSGAGLNQPNDNAGYVHFLPYLPGAGQLGGEGLRRIPRPVQR